MRKRHQFLARVKKNWLIERANKREANKREANKPKREKEMKSETIRNYWQTSQVLKIDTSGIYTCILDIDNKANAAHNMKIIRCNSATIKLIVVFRYIEMI